MTDFQTILFLPYKLFLLKWEENSTKCPMEIQKSKHLRVKNENFQAIYLGSTNYFIYF